MITLSNPAIYNILEAFSYFFYNDALLRKFLVIISTIIFIRTISNYLYQHAIGAASSIGVFRIIILTVTFLTAVIFGFQLLLMLEFGFILFSIALDFVYSYYEYQRYYKRQKNPNAPKASKTEQKAIKKSTKQALKKYTQSKLFQEAIQTAHKEGYTCFELFPNGIRFYRYIPEASFCRNWLMCEKTYTDPNAYLADSRTIFNTSFMPDADTLNGIEVYDLPFHKYEMYSLDIEDLQGLSFALQKKLGKNWSCFCHATEVRLNTNTQKTSKVIALTYLFITREALKYI